MSGFAEVGLALRWLRERRDFTLDQVAQGASIAPSSLSRFERGQRQPKLETLSRILQALEADAFQLALALRVNDGGDHGLTLPDGLTERECIALALAAFGFQDFIEATARRLTTGEPGSGSMKQPERPEKGPAGLGPCSE